jgi:hypothetical protein
MKKYFAGPPPGGRQNVRRRLCAAAIAGAALGASGNAHAATFPADGSWVPVTQGNQGLGDPGNDGSTNAREVVGDAAHPALYIFSDGTSFFFRVRLDIDPQSAPGNLGPFGWGILIDSDGDYGKFDFSLMVSGKNNEENIQYWKNNTPTTGGDPTDAADVLLKSYANTFSGAGQNVRVVTAPSTFNGNADFFLDIAIPLADLLGAGNSNFSATTPLTFWVGASSSANAIQTDLAGTSSAPGPGTLAGTASDKFLPTGNPVLSDTDGDGVPDVTEQTLGTNANAKDTDGDGVQDNVELSASGSSGPFAAIDTDGDGTIDAKDTDSDNDCKPDATDSARRDPALPSASPSGNCGGGAPICDTNSGTCVPACTVDANCGTATSGKVCSGQPLGCVAGCRGNGGNGCPNGTTCSSVTNAVGTCFKTDTDGDGIPDVDEAVFGTDPTKADTDGDGIPDPVELSPSGSSGPFAAIDSDNDGVIDAKDGDSDNDGIPDYIENGFSTIPVDSDGDGVADFRDLDSDNDGIPDLWENGGRSADGNSDGRIDPFTDADGDGVAAAFDHNDADANDRVLKNPLVNTDGTDAPDYLDLDSDGDRVTDVIESGSFDVDRDEHVDNFTDVDHDGLTAAVDPDEGGTALTLPDFDADGAPNFQDSDDDGDTLLTKDELGPGGPANPINSDDDAAPNYLDSDDDNDGLLTKDEVADSNLAAVGSNDVDGDGKLNWLDDDADADGIKDATDGRADTNGNGRPEYLDPTDTDGDGIADVVEAQIGSDPKDPDTDKDGINDGDEVGGTGKPRDTDGDGIIDVLDDDDDGDGIKTRDELGDAKLAGASDDVDNDGLKNWLDDDADGDQRKDGEEGRGDSDNDGKPNYLDPFTQRPADDAPSNRVPFGPPDPGIMEGGGISCTTTRPASHGSDGLEAALLLGLTILARRRRR